MHECTPTYIYELHAHTHTHAHARARTHTHTHAHTHTVTHTHTHARTHTPSPQLLSGHTLIMRKRAGSLQQAPLNDLREAVEHWQDSADVISFLVGALYAGDVTVRIRGSGTF